MNVEVMRLDPAIDEIVPPNPKIYKLAEGFQFTEGPGLGAATAAICSSAIRTRTPCTSTGRSQQRNGELSVFRHPSGYSGADIAEYGQPGSNGLTLDPQGRLTINEHGNHRVTRLEKDG